MNNPYKISIQSDRHLDYQLIKEFITNILQGIKKIKILQLLVIILLSKSRQQWIEISLLF